MCQDNLVGSTDRSFSVDKIILTQDDLVDSSSWSPPPFVLLRETHTNFLSD
jgi:hypothetical protein